MVGGAEVIGVICVLYESTMRSIGSDRGRNIWRIAGLMAMAMAAICAALPTLLAGAAEAAQESVVVTDSAGPLLTGWNRRLDLALHNPERGTLDSVDITVTALASGSIKAENVTDADAEIGGALAAEVAFGSPGRPISGALEPSIERLDNVASDDGSLDYQGAAGRTWDDLESDPATWTTTIDDPDQLDTFVGQGTFGIDVQARTRTRVVPEGSSRVQTFAAVEVTVEYHVRQPGISGFFWNDTNDNGRQDNGELGIPGVMVMLVSDGEVVSSASSGSAGGFRISPVPAGDYELVLGQPIGYRASSGPEGLRIDEGGVAVPVSVTSENVRIDVGFEAGVNQIADSGSDTATTSTTAASATSTSTSSPAASSTTVGPGASTTTSRVAAATTTSTRPASTTTRVRAEVTTTSSAVAGSSAATTTTVTRSSGADTSTTQSGGGGTSNVTGPQVAGASEQAAGVDGEALATTGSAQRSLYVASLLLLMVGLGCMIVSRNARAA